MLMGIDSKLLVVLLLQLEIKSPTININVIFVIFKLASKLKISFVGVTTNNLTAVTIKRKPNRMSSFIS
jgi:hypothetical protein